MFAIFHNIYIVASWEKILSVPRADTGFILDRIFLTSAFASVWKKGSRNEPFFRPWYRNNYYIILYIHNPTNHNTFIS